MKDDWNNTKFVNKWDSAIAITNPDRSELLELLTAIVADNYKENKYILDLGCGSGLVEKQILKNFQIQNLSASIRPRLCWPRQQNE